MEYAVTLISWSVALIVCVVGGPLAAQAEGDLFWNQNHSHECLRNAWNVSALVWPCDVIKQVSVM